MTAKQNQDGRQACSVIACGQELVNGGVPVDRLIESERVKYAAPAKWVAKLIYGGGMIYCCDDCKAKLDHCRLDWSSTQGGEA